MDIEKLKQKVLELAITGKLVPQAPNDESASMLVEKIKKEKEELIKQGKIKKEKNESYIFKGADNCYYEKIGNLIETVSTLNKEVKTKDVSLIGLYPVISQSKDFIDGYCNDETKVINCVPAILFGDHTRVVKYIDIPFIPGADGTKIFTAKCYSKYLFYLIKYASFNIENRGYARHCALLKNYEVPFFSSKGYQINISITLDHIFCLIDALQAEKNSINFLIHKVKFKILDYFFGENSSYKSYYENELKLGDILEYEQPSKYIVNSTDYSDDNTIPVLTPGKTFILGYTNEQDGIYKVNGNKVIIFDDFTTVSRLVDFDFKVKSSAIKILTINKEELYDIEYMYLYLQTIHVNNNTHKRYWLSDFASRNVKIHTINMQKKIVQEIKQLYATIEKVAD